MAAAAVQKRRLDCRWMRCNAVDACSRTRWASVFSGHSCSDASASAITSANARALGRGSDSALSRRVAAWEQSSCEVDLACHASIAARMSSTRANRSAGSLDSAFIVIDERLCIASTVRPSGAGGRPRCLRQATTLAVVEHERISVIIRATDPGVPPVVSWCGGEPVSMA